jgi:hypothetical protein
MRREYVEAAIVIRNDHVEIILDIYARHSYKVCAFSLYLLFLTYVLIVLGAVIETLAH